VPGPGVDAAHGADHLGAEEQVVDAIEFGHDCCKRIARGIRELMSKVGKTKWGYEPPKPNEEIAQKIAASVREELSDALNTQKYEKLDSYHRVKEAKKKAVALFPEEQQPEAGKLFDALKERIFRDQMLKDKRRPDGRRFDEIRSIWCEVGALPRTHGSAIFTRGETQALVTTTLGTKDDEQRIEMFDLPQTSKRFMLHYNFPPFSVGEVGFMRGPGRREIGHGALAERALAPIVPDEKAFPYTLRLVSDILESNGSSSMASVCGGTLSMMDAGVPILAPVAGIAMGLVMEGKDYAILTDIAGAEDHYGDMDFKVAGTKDGITGLQMDIKIPTVTTAIMREALAQGKKARLEILEKMLATLANSRPELSEYAPRIYTTKIPTDKIRELIGPGGKVIKGIIDQTGVKIDVDDDGTVNIFASDGESASRAMQMVADIAAVAEVGKTYLGKVVRIAEFGAFVEIFPGTDGLLHISEISESRIKNVRDELKEGDQILVKVLAREGNKIKLSRKAILREQREKLKGTTGEGSDDGAGGGEGEAQPVASDDRPPRERSHHEGGDRPRGDRPPRRDRGDRPPRRNDH